MEISTENATQSLGRMPTELITKIYNFLPSFSDVFALSATNSRLRSVWIENANNIYKKVAPRSIPCERHVRNFLFEQGGPALNTAITAQDVVHIMRTVLEVGKATDAFEKSCTKFPDRGLIARRRELTPKERRRFIRAYYQCWSILRLDETAWRARLDCLTIKQLYHLCEMAKLDKRFDPAFAEGNYQGYDRSKNNDEILPKIPSCPHALCSYDQHSHVPNDNPSTRDTLEWEVWNHIKETCTRIFDSQAGDFWDGNRFQISAWFSAVWDCNQEDLEWYVCCNEISRKSEDGIWEYSSDEES